MRTAAPACHSDQRHSRTDAGFIKVLSTKFTPDRGALLENLVFTTLSGEMDLMNYSNAGECDFNAFDGERPKMAIQATTELNVANRDREISGLYRAMDALDLKDGIIVTLDQEEALEIDGKRINIVPAWKWLLGD